MVSNSGRHPGGSSSDDLTLARQMAPLGETGPPWNSSAWLRDGARPVRQHRVQRQLGDLVDDHSQGTVGVEVQDQHDTLVEDPVG